MVGSDSRCVASLGLPPRDGGALPDVPPLDGGVAKPPRTKGACGVPASFRRVGVANPYQVLQVAQSPVGRGGIGRRRWEG